MTVSHSLLSIALLPPVPREQHPMSTGDFKKRQPADKELRHDLPVLGTNPIAV